MAYAVELNLKCKGRDGACNKRVTHEVFNNRNGSHGKFCASCARRIVEELKKYEG